MGADIADRAQRAAHLGLQRQFQSVGLAIQS